MPLRRSLRALALGGALALIAGPAPAQDEPRDPRYLPPAEQEAWAERLAEAQARVESARESVTTLELAYFEMRHEDHPRGEPRQKLVADLEDAREELAAAKADKTELVEEARRAGVLPGVLRPYWE